MDEDNLGKEVAAGPDYGKGYQQEIERKRSSESREVSGQRGRY